MVCGKVRLFYAAFRTSPTGTGNNHTRISTMTENQLKQARRDQQEKQHALYGYCLTPAPDQKRKSIRWGAVFLAVCLAVFVWLVVLIILDAI